MGFSNLEIVKTEMVHITPEIARVYLGSNKTNRPLRSNTVRAYAKDMETGNWRTTHQGIAINELGDIIDGQHRLSAIVYSNCAITMMVTTYKGPISALQSPFDLSLKRTLADLTGINKRSLEPISFLIRELTNCPGRKIESSLVDFVNSHPNAVEYVGTKLTQTSRAIFSAAPIRAGVLLAYIAGLGDYSDQFNKLVNLDLENLSTSAMCLYKRLVTWGGATAGPLFRRYAFGMTFLVAKDKDFNQSRVHDATIERAFEQAKEIFKTI